MKKRDKIEVSSTIDINAYINILKIFQRLHTINEYEGTEIGLAISKMIIERHNGRIGVEYEFGTGTTFYFTL